MRHIVLNNGKQVGYKNGKPQYAFKQLSDGSSESYRSFNPRVLRLKRRK